MGSGMMGNLDDENVAALGVATPVAVQRLRLCLSCICDVSCKKFKTTV